MKFSFPPFLTLPLSPKHTHKTTQQAQARPSSTATTLTPTLLNARRLRSQGHYGQALALLRPAVKAARGAAAAAAPSEDGDQAWVENEWGSYCYLQGDLHGAREAFARALELDPGESRGEGGGRWGWWGLGLS